MRGQLTYIFSNPYYWVEGTILDTMNHLYGEGQYCTPMKQINQWGKLNIKVDKSRAKSFIKNTKNMTQNERHVQIENYTKERQYPPRNVISIEFISDQLYISPF